MMMTMPDGRERPSITVEGGQLRVQSVLNDIAGNPVLVLETNYARSISAAGNSMVNYVLALMGGVLAITGLAILLMLNRTVLKPVARLMDRVLEARGVTGRPRTKRPNQAPGTATRMRSPSSAPNSSGRWPSLRKPATGWSSRASIPAPPNWSAA